MGLLVDVTKITGATAGTIGTNEAGSAQTVDNLGGWTMYGTRAEERPSDSNSLNVLVQTNDSTAPTVRIDASAATLAGANTYHRASLRVKLARQYRDGTGSASMQAVYCSVAPGFTVGEWVEENSSGLPRGKYFGVVDTNIAIFTECQGVFTADNGGAASTLTGRTSGVTRTAVNTSGERLAFRPLIDINGNTAASNRGRVCLAMVNPQLAAPDSMRLAGSALSASLYVEDPAGAYAGAELSRNHTECGNAFLNSAGTGIASMAGTTYSTPNFTLDEWVWMDVIVDKTAKRLYLLIERHLVGFHSYANTAANTTTSWTFTLPTFPGMRWMLIGCQSFTDTTHVNDTTVTLPRVSSVAARTWKLAPTFAALTSCLVNHLTVGATNATFLSRPMSVVSGTRPFSEFGEWTTTSNAGVACPFSISGMPYVTKNGWATFLMAMRLEGTTWSGTFGFTGQASFTVDYSGGSYRLRDYAGTVIYTWAANEQPMFLIGFNRTAGRVKCVVYNNSKDITATICGGNDVTLHPSDSIPASGSWSMAGQLTATTNAVKATIEMVSMWRQPTILTTDSFTAGPLQGSLDQSNPGGGIGQVGTFATAARNTINSSAFVSAAYNDSDANCHGLCTFPYSYEMPKLNFIPLGRSGRKFTDWRNYQLAGLDHLMCYHHIVLDGRANDMDGATSSGLADSISDTLASDFERAALHALERGGDFTWIECDMPMDLSAGTNSPSPTAAPFGRSNSKECYYKSGTKIRAKLERLQATHARGHHVHVCKVGKQAHADGIHPGTYGTIGILADAITQLKGSLDRADAIDESGASRGGSFAAGLVAGLAMAGR